MARPGGGTRENDNDRAGAHGSAPSHGRCWWRARPARRARRALLAATTALTASVGGAGLAAWAAVPAAAATGPATAVPAAAAPDTSSSYKFGPAYWLASNDGGIFAYGHAGFAGSPAGSGLRKPVVAVTATSTGQGYWLVASDGGVFAYGDAGFFGSPVGNVPLRKHIVAMAATPSGHGYWLVGADGGVFAYGDAGYFGSPGDLPLRKPIVGIAATRSGEGYWLVASDGGVFAYGDAGFHGAPEGEALRAPVVSITTAPTGEGYWVAAADGGVFAYGDAGFFGSPVGAALRAPIVGLAANPNGEGYWLGSSDGGVFAYGGSGYFGSMVGRRMTGRVVGITGGFAPARAQQTVIPPLPATTGYDISWPQCPGNQQPGQPYGFGIVGVTGGRAFTTNPCLAGQADWASAAGSGAGVYVNLNYPSDGGWGQGANGPAGACALGDSACALTNFGANAVSNAIGYADASGAKPPFWWLDVETTNYWSPDTGANSHIIQGAIDELRRRHLGVGIYSTGYQFRVIAGGYAPGVPVWLAGATDIASAQGWCGHPGFGGGTPWLVQTVQGQFDVDVACPPVVEHPERVFDLTPPPPAPVSERNWAGFS